MAAAAEAEKKAAKEAYEAAKKTLTDAMTAVTHMGPAERDDLKERNVLKGCLKLFETYLNKKVIRKNKHGFSHPGLTNRYGIELEYAASSNRYVIGHKVNSCMWNQNAPWWRKNFDALSPAGISPDAELPDGVRPLTTDADGAARNFNQWSSFFLEIAGRHGTTSHRGDHRCENRGNGSARIENDSSVTVEHDGPGITLWSSKVENLHKQSDLRGVDTQPAGGGPVVVAPWGEKARGLRGDVCDFDYQKELGFSNHTLKGVNLWYVPNHPEHIRGPVNHENKLELIHGNELVTGVLTNVYVKYPYGNNGANEIIERSFPLGSLLLDNLINHIISHKTVIAIQRMGFHVHLSEFPRISDATKRKQFIIGFIKLFYMFEPMFYALHPHYRSESAWCQSLQSVFTFNEIRHAGWEEIWEDLVNDTHISGVRRKKMGLGHPSNPSRYLSVNLTNCKEGGIGTIEIRLGHCVFSSQYIQAYINILQSLFSFSHAIFNHYNDYTAHHWIMDYINKENHLPAYCRQTSFQYNNEPPIERKLTGVSPYIGRPLYGFFTSSPLDRTQKKKLIVGLMKVFFGVTGCQAIEHLLPMVNYYHSGSVAAWYNRQNIENPIDWTTEIKRPVLALMFPGVVEAAATVNYDFNKFGYLKMGASYFLNEAKKGDTDHRCATCSLGSPGAGGVRLCAPIFNRGDDPQRTPSVPRVPTNQGYIYKQACPDNKWTFNKLQTELISYKIKTAAFPFVGGGRKRTYKKKITNNKTKKLSHSQKGGVVTNNNQSALQVSKSKSEFEPEMASTSKPILLSEEEEFIQGIKMYYQCYRVNEGAERITITKGKSALVVNYVDWMGGYTPDDTLSAIVNYLITNKIIDKETLDVLEDRRYIDFHIYLTETPIHMEKLYKELAGLKLSKETVDQIIKVYKMFTSKSVASNTITMPLMLEKSVPTEKPKTGLELVSRITTLPSASKAAFANSSKMAAAPAPMANMIAY